MRSGEIVGDIDRAFESYPAKVRQECPFFAIRFLRWVIESGAVSEIGPDAFAVLAAVVLREDSIRFARPPSFFNDQLARDCGIRSEPALMRARDRAVAARLLSYRPGAKRRPGVYFVQGFAPENVGETGGKPKRKRSENEVERLPSNPDPDPVLVPPSTPIEVNTAGQGDTRFPNPEGLASIKFSLTNQTVLLDQGRVDGYRRTYAWEIEWELRKASQWLRDNPTSRPKSMEGLYRFLTGWLNRTDERRFKVTTKVPRLAQAEPDTVLDRLRSLESATPMRGGV